MAAARVGRKGINPDYIQELSGRYFVRVVVPKELRATMGKSELRAPLGPDRRVALTNRHGFIATFLGQIAAARTRKAAAPHTSAAALAHRHYAELLAIDDAMRSDHRNVSVGVDDLRVAALRDVVAGRLSDPDTADVVGAMVDTYRRHGLSAEPGTPAWRELARTVAAVELEALRRLYERDEGDFTGEPGLPVLKEPPPPPTTTVPLMDLLDAYLVERAHLGKGAEARRRWTPVFRQLVTYLGHDDAAAVTAEKAEEWLTDVLTRKAPKTVRDTDLGSLKAVFKWAKRRKRVSHNPFEDVSLDAPRAVRTREKGFTDDEAIALLKAALAYRPKTSTNPRTRESSTLSAAKRWTPWLGAFTGARIAELTQLRKEDVRTQDGVHFLRITPEAGSVKTGHYRDVPLHPQLVEIGFLDFVAAAPAGPLFYETGSRRKPGASHPSKQVAGRLAGWIRALDIIGEVPPNHAWRHRLKTIAREVGADMRIVEAIVGHASRTAGDDYGDVRLGAKLATLTRLPSYALT